MIIILLFPKGFASKGMVLAAKSADGSKIELVEPPLDASIGSLVSVSGLSGNAWGPSKAKKMKKVWEAASVDLATNDNCIVCWKNQPLVVLSTLEQCKVSTLINSQVS